MVLLVNPRIEHRMVKGAMNPVDAHVGEQEKGGHREQQVEQAVLADVCVELRVAAHLGEPDRHMHERHHHERLDAALDFERNLIRQELLVLLEPLVKHQRVVDRRNAEIGNRRQYPANEARRQRLPQHVVARPATWI